MPDKENLSPNEQILQMKPLPFLKLPYEWKNQDIIDNPDPNLDQKVQQMGSELKERPEYQQNKFEWQIQPLLEQTNGNQEPNFAELPNHLQPRGFEREDLPGNQYKVMIQLSNTTIAKTYTYVDDQIAANGVPSNVTLASRLLHDYATDQTLTMHKDLQQDKITAKEIHDQFQANHWSRLELTDPAHPDQSLVVTPDRSDPEEDFFDMFRLFTKPHVEINDEVSLLNVAHDFNHLSDIFNHDKEVAKARENFFEQNIEGHTPAQHELASEVQHAIRDTWDRTNTLAEHTEAELPNVANKLHLPLLVAIAANEFAENKQRYSDWCHDAPDAFRPRTNDEWGVTYTETKPFAGIPATEYHTEWRKEHPLPVDIVQPGRQWNIGSRADFEDAITTLKGNKFAAAMSDSDAVRRSEQAEVREQRLQVYHQAKEKDYVWKALTDEQRKDVTEALLKEEKEKNPQPTEGPKPNDKFVCWTTVQNKKGETYVQGTSTIENAPDVVYFKKNYGGHEFNDKEIASLLSGDEISIPTRSGQGSVKLGPGTVNGHDYFGVQRTDIPQKGRPLPNTPEIAHDQTELQAE